MEKLKISRPVIVEGKYDKITLGSVMEGYIIPTGGFGVFNDKEKTALIRRLCERTGVIVLTDSDGGGRQIRAYLSSVLPKDKVIHLYIPRLAGKERRKERAGRAGLLGVEGMDASLLYELLAPYADGAEVRATGGITKADFYLDGLSGGEGAAIRRAALAESLSLPADMTANALLSAINLLMTPEEYRAALTRIDPDASFSPAEGEPL